MSTAKFDAWLNTDGTENYKCRAWVNFNGAGTVAIRASGNVSSITDNGTGDYTVNFTAAMPDANYSVCGISAAPAAMPASSAQACFAAPHQAAPTTSAVRLVTYVSSTGGLYDSVYISVIVLR